MVSDPCVFVLPSCETTTDSQMWEDPANANGGKWVILFRSAPYLLDFAWANLPMALVGEILDPEDKVCGVVASSRPKVDRIQVWTRSRDDVEGINLIGRRILESMSLEGRESENMSMDFQVCRLGAVYSFTRSSL
jgi:translation initiation factor 4E